MQHIKILNQEEVQRAIYQPYHTERRTNFLNAMLILAGFIAIIVSAYAVLQPIIHPLPIIQ